MMKKKVVCIAAATVLLTGLCLIRKKRSKFAYFLNTLLRAGIPDQMTTDQQTTDIENANMVAEGSSFGVNWYDQARDEH